jgi:hypothetical protein
VLALHNFPKARVIDASSGKEEEKFEDFGNKYLNLCLIWCRGGKRKNNRMKKLEESRR